MSHGPEDARKDGPRTLDVAHLPTFAFGHRSPMWWGTMGLIAIESTVFALAIMTYFYLRSHAHVWPMTERGEPPDLLWGTVNTFILLLSMIPNEIARRAAEKLDLSRVRVSLFACLGFALAFLAVRAFEFTALHTRWDSDAYGSIVWMLMGLHTLHLLTDTWDSAVLAVLMVTGPVDGKRFADVSENAVYWYFVVASWLPIYATVYFGARI
ncbi:heme/copper-type cytochrome/quinol oxidase subunit 3 [Pseudoduganella flava]|uniref:Cytochrome C oxidase subunit III n=1 Tax=Pseudoduganella flava TaxID=871742 RepID=A0A562PVJ8_9BURK|nr:cytochrome c oxidase subunit 3 [Pseudoduganella flava]QGZ39550.1 cytochrome C oxidase subunit III [Pseudoduganella flava]TWI48444.1 heme/copper-type cytochrome/quinol oxidase subunit 3 [Pseudoduganella flava]